MTATDPSNTATSESSEPVAPWKRPLTAALLVALIAPFFYFGFVLAKSDMEQYSLTVAVLLAGGALGWVIGIFISPLPREGEQFQSYAKAIAAGVSGYGLAKIDPILTVLVDPVLATQPLLAFRFLGFMVAFVVAMLGAFGWRRYG